MAILGSAHADGLRVEGTAAATVHGGGGNDYISAGDGADILVGGDGTDTIFGGPGADRLTGGGGADTLDGGPGDDRLHGDEDAPEFFSRTYEGDDALRGGEGDDVLDGGGGFEVHFAEPGNDHYTSTGRTAFSPGQHDRQVVTYADSPVGIRASNDERANDGRPNEYDRISSSIDAIVGSQHADVIEVNGARPGFWGPVVMGLGGDDVLRNATNDDQPSAPAPGLLTGSSGSFIHTRVSYFSYWRWTYHRRDLLPVQLPTTPFASALIGGDGADRLEGGSGADFLAGGGDTGTIEPVTPAPGPDRYLGGAGNDTIDLYPQAGPPPELLDCGPGIDFTVGVGSGCEHVGDPARDGRFQPIVEVSPSRAPGRIPGRVRAARVRRGYQVWLLLEGPPEQVLTGTCRIAAGGRGHDVRFRGPSGQWVPLNLVVRTPRVRFLGCEFDARPL